MSQPSRREMIAGAAAAIATAQRPILGANDRVNLAIVGVGGRGMNHVQEYCKLPDAHIAAIVDVNQAAQERASAYVSKERGHTPKTYYDMREAFADKSIDAISTATPNHWHVLTSYWAVKAGKDVYCEKPVSYNMFESKQLIAAARKYNKIVQVGQQSRSIPHKMRAMQLLREGVIGKVYLAKGLCYKRRKSIGHKPDTATPAGVNWDMFLGPAPLRPFNELRFRYNWHWFWDTGNGDIGNQGVHEMDIALWGLGKTTLPKSVVAYGGKLLYDDDQETPNTQTAYFDFGDVQMEFEVRGLLTMPEGGLDFGGGKNVVGDIFFGSDGVLSVDGNGFSVWKGEDRKLELEEKAKRSATSETGDHMANFIAAVKSRKWQDLRCDVATAAIAADCCHLANMSYRLGRKLNFDPGTHRFTDADANKMMTRPVYRKPYVVPENV